MLLKNGSTGEEVKKLQEKLGITADEWNTNKATLLLYFANEFCGIENKLNRN